MKTYISMLRGINVSGQKKIKMEDLKKLYESLNFSNIITYIQSGNVIFECPHADIVELAKKIETQILQTFGFTVTVIIRTKDAFHHVIKNNPFIEEQREDINKLHVTFLSDMPSESLLIEINKFNCQPDQFIIVDREIYLYCPDGYGRTKLNNNFFEKKLNVSATTRNWKTVTKLYDLAK